jgi:hypothetical protein
MASPATATSSSGPGRLPRLALAAVLVLGVVLGFVALFHQQQLPAAAGSSSVHGKQPPSVPATEVLGLDSEPAATTQQQQQQQQQQAPVTTATATGRTSSPITTSNPKTAATGLSSLFLAFTSAVGLSDKAQQDVSAEADAVEGGGFLSVKGCTPEDGEELMLLVEGAGLTHSVSGFVQSNRPDLN